MRVNTVKSLVTSEGFVVEGTHFLIGRKGFSEVVLNGAMMMTFSVNLSYNYGCVNTSPSFDN